MKTQKFLSLVLVLVMIISSLSVFATGAFAAADKWDGKTANVKWYVAPTTAGVFEIKTAADLYGFTLISCARDRNSTINLDSKVYYDANYNVIFDKNLIGTASSVAGQSFKGQTIKLAADIDLDNHPFIPIGSSGSFQGVFDGQGHTISNLYENYTVTRHTGQSSPQFYYGLFAYIAVQAEVKNVKVVNAVFDIDMPEDCCTNVRLFCGGIVGSLHNESVSKITDCSIDGLTINFKPHSSYLPVTTDTGFTQSSYIGAIAGRVYTATEHKNNKVTDFALNIQGDKNLILIDDSYVFGALHSQTAASGFTNCSVTLKQVNSGDNNQGGSNEGNNPDTGDFTTVAIAVVAMISLAGAAVVISKKRTNR